MKKTLFNQLLESEQRTDEIVRGERQPSREFFLDAAKVRIEVGGLRELQVGDALDASSIARHSAPRAGPEFTFDASWVVAARHGSLS